MSSRGIQAFLAHLRNAGKPRRKGVTTWGVTPGHRYSPLDQITGRMSEPWRSRGVGSRFHTDPARGNLKVRAYDRGVLYTPTAFTGGGHRPGTAKTIWTFTPNPANLAEQHRPSAAGPRVLDRWRSEAVFPTRSTGGAIDQREDRAEPIPLSAETDRDVEERLVEVARFRLSVHRRRLRCRRRRHRADRWGVTAPNKEATPVTSAVTTCARQAALDLSHDSASRRDATRPGKPAHGSTPATPALAMRAQMELGYVYLPVERRRTISRVIDSGTICSAKA